jgi:hypothetical protein
MGNTDIEDGLRRLDKLTQEEARMASAELLKITHSVDSKVMGIDDRMKGVEGKIQDVRGDVHEVGNKAQDVDDQLVVNRSLSLQLCSTFLSSDLFTGNHLRDRFLRWLSPSDPSINHNIACGAHHSGTTRWFFQSSIYNQWKSSGSFLWVRGKRALLLVFSMQ